MEEQSTFFKIFLQNLTAGGLELFPSPTGSTPAGPELVHLRWTRARVRQSGGAETADEFPAAFLTQGLWSLIPPAPAQESFSPSGTSPVGKRLLCLRQFRNSNAPAKPEPRMDLPIHAGLCRRFRTEDANSYRAAKGLKDVDMLPI